MSGSLSRLCVATVISILIICWLVNEFTDIFVIMVRKKQVQDVKQMPPLQILREAAGLSQAALAKKIPDKTRTKSLNQSVISNWETGKDEPELTIVQVKALCQALGKNLDELPDDFGPPKQSGSSSPGE
jgi:putative transcriptional regulator